MADDIEKLIDGALARLTEKRLRHTLGVMETGIHLGELYGGDPDKIRLAAAMHDLFRGKTVDEINNYVNHYGLPDRYLGNANLAHSKIAAEYMSEIGINDVDILNAVSYHTTGRAGMSLLEKIVFLADAIEPGRDYPGVDELRELAESDLDAACAKALENSISFVRSKGETLDPDTVSALEYLKQQKIKIEKGNSMEISSKELALKACEVLSNKKGSDIKSAKQPGDNHFTQQVFRCAEYRAVCNDHAPDCQEVKYSFFSFIFFAAYKSITPATLNKLITIKVINNAPKGFIIILFLTFFCFC